VEKITKDKNKKTGEGEGGGRGRGRSQTGEVPSYHIGFIVGKSQ